MNMFTDANDILLNFPQFVMSKYTRRVTGESDVEIWRSAPDRDRYGDCQVVVHLKKEYPLIYCDILLRPLLEKFEYDYIHLSNAGVIVFAEAVV